MIRAFLDASVLFAAAYSATGASREIIHLGLRGRVDLVISGLVVEEAERNLAQKAPEAIPYLEVLLSVAEFEIVEASKRQVVTAAAYTKAKDAPIVAAAKRAKVDYLVSLDRKHLVNDSEVARHSGLTIVLPGTLLQLVREGSDRL